jgi:hypothetical protein
LSDRWSFDFCYLDITATGAMVDMAGRGSLAMQDSDQTWTLPPDVQPDDMLYVADRNLRICFTNDEWTRFAGSNNGQSLGSAAWNHNVLDNMSGKERARWMSIYRLLLDGRLPFHEERFNCSSPVERRNYRLRITPRLDEKGSVAFLIHHTIRLDQRKEPTGNVVAALQQIDRDPRQALASYRKHIERSIEIDGFRVLKDLRPLEEIGGDFLWHRRYANGTTDLVHGDAMGHGEAAGLYAARVVLVLNAVCDSQVSPSRVLAVANERLAEAAVGDEVNFATGLLLRFHAGSEELTVCAFAHNGVLFSRTGVVPMQTGLPIGLTASTDPWPETTLHLAEHGRRFLLFSDGITEQFDERGDFFGVERLLEIFRKTENQPLEQLLGEIHDALERFRGGAIIKDDRTLLAIEYDG